MAQYIKQPSIWGRIGTGLGQGLAEQLPKEIERGRMAAGLQQLEGQKGLTPFQQFSRLSTLPGVTPQMLQSGAELLRQQGSIDALKRQYEEGGPRPYAPTKEQVEAPVRGEIPTLSTPEATKESYRTYIPPTDQELRSNAFQNLTENPQRYGNNFEKALEEQYSIAQRNADRQKAFREQESLANKKESEVKDAFRSETQKLALNNLPPNSIQKYEEKMLNAILPKSEGGEGLTVEQATKKYSKDAEQENRDYLDLGSLSAWSPRDFNRRLDALQKNFATRGDQKLMMDQLISEYQLSPMYAAHRAYPIKKGDIPTLAKTDLQIGASTISGVKLPKITEAMYGKLKEEMGTKHSPLSVAYELNRQGQDPREWLRYLDKNRDNLSVWQADQLSKNVNFLDLKDKWLATWE
jgi:hypothetical protein